MKAPGTSPRLDVYDIAYLAGGPERVVDTALVALVESGRVRVHGTGQLAVVEPGRSDPVGAAVMDAIGTRGHRSVDVVRWRLADDDRVLSIGRRLATAGLVRRWRVVPRRTARAAVLTAAGRRTLRALVSEPPRDPALDGGTALLVALHGRARLSDDLRRSFLFEPVRVPTAKERAAGIRRRLDGLSGDPSYARGGVGDGGVGGGGDGGS